MRRARRPLVSAGPRLPGLVLRLGVHRRPQSLGLLLAGVMLGAPAVALSVMHQSGLEAIADSVRAEFGYEDGMKVQAEADAAPAVAADPGVTAVRIDDTTVATPSARTESAIWWLSGGKAPLGLVTQGRHVAAAGEASVSRHLAETLGVRLGSSITLSQEGRTVPSVRVVGITSDPANRRGDLVISVAEPAMAPRLATGLPGSSHPGCSRCTGLSRQVRMGASRLDCSIPPGTLAAVRQAMPVVTILMILAVLAAVAAQVPGSRRDMDALQAAGMSQDRSWRVVAAWMALLVAVGSAIGAMAASAALWAAKDPVSAAFGQRWTGAALLAAGSGMTMVALLAAGETTQTRHPVLLGLAGILGTVLGARLCANGLVGLARGRAVHHLTRRLAGLLTAGTSAALLVATACASYAAWHTHNTKALASFDHAPQAPGSFLVCQALSGAADEVLVKFRAAGGRHSFVHDLPDEDHAMVRGVSPAAVRCFQRAPVGHGPSRSERLDSCVNDHGGVMNIAV